MQFLILLYYFLRSVLLRGPYHTAMLLLEETRGDKKLNVHTSEFKRSGSKLYFHYQGAAYYALSKIFRTLADLAINFSFTDIGAGRGRVLFVAEQNGFKNITGIELDEQLCRSATLNIAQYVPIGSESVIKLINANALDHTFEDKPEVYFLFNPFNGNILGQVLDKINTENKQEKFFVYMNPLYKSEFEKRNFVEVKRIRSFLYTEAIVYKPQ